MAQTRKPGKPQQTKAFEAEVDEVELEDELYEEDLANLNKETGRAFDIAALVLCLIGIGIASYLSYAKITNSSIVCTGSDSCDTVNSSRYAYILGVPVAYLGLFFYLAMLALTIGRARLTNHQDETAVQWRGRLDLALFAFALSGVAFTAYLKATEIFLIGAICLWCVGSAIVVVALFGLFTVRFLRN